MPLQIRRGTEVERENMAQPLAQGELLYTTDNRILYVGDGATLGGVQITGYRDEDAQDAAAAMITGGTHNGINFVYNDLSNRIDATVDLSNYTGTLKADAFKGSVFGDDSTPMVDAVNNTFNGDLTGNVTGTILTAAQPNITSLGTLTSLAVTGAITGTSFAGNVITGLISSADSSAIRVDTPTIFETGVFIEDNLQVSGRSIFNEEVIHQTNLSNDRILTVSQHHGSVDTASTLTLRRSRGSLSFELDVQSGDIIGEIASNAKVTNGYVLSSIIRSRVDGTVTSSYAPGRLEFLVTDDTGALTRPMTINRLGEVAVRGTLQVSNNTYDSALPLAFFQQNHSTVDARNVAFIRGRGTFETPLSNQANDDITDLQFSGHDGTNYFVAAAVQVKIDSAVSTGNVRAGFEFLTYNGTNLSTRVKVGSTGLLEAFNSLAVTGRVDFITGEQTTVGAAGAASALPATPSTYFKIKVNGVEYVVPAYLAS